MKTLTTMLLVALALTACGGCDEQRPKGSAPFGIEFVSIAYEGGNDMQAYGHYTLRMRIVGADCVQELTLTNKFDPAMNTQLVECFHVGAGDIDTHSGFRGETREMSIYPASVEGVELVNGWGILPQNLDGSFVTAPNALLELGTNYEGWAIQGRVASADMARAILWRTEARDDRVYLWIDGVEHGVPEP
jgi:hypothetical protein